MAAPPCKPDKIVTKVLLEFLNNVTPVFEEFLTIFHNKSPTIHVLYDSMTLMRRFLKSSVIEGNCGSKLATIDCQDTQSQLSDKELVTGDATQKAMENLPPENRKKVLLGIRSFYLATISYLQMKLPLSNDLLRALGCLNPKKRHSSSTVSSIGTLARELQPTSDVSKVLYEWKSIWKTLT